MYIYMHCDILNEKDVILLYVGVRCRKIRELIK